MIHRTGPGFLWISIEYRENLRRFALADLDEPGSTLGSPTASQIVSYHHIELSRGVLMCRGFAKLGLGAELAHLQCESHHRGNEGNNTILFLVVPYSGRYGIVTIVPCFDSDRRTASELAPSSERAE